MLAWAQPVHVEATTASWEGWRCFIISTNASRGRSVHDEGEEEAKEGREGNLGDYEQGRMGEERVHGLQPLSLEVALEPLTQAPSPLQRLGLLVETLRLKQLRGGRGGERRGDGIAAEEELRLDNVLGGARVGQAEASALVEHVVVEDDGHA